MRIFRWHMGSKELDECIDHLHVRGCPSQSFTLGFAVECREETDLSFTGGGNLDVFWAKQWTQPGTGLTRSEPTCFPELLLKSEQSHTSTYRWRRPGWQPWGPKKAYFVHPKVRLKGPVSLTLRANQVEHFLVKGRVVESATIEIREQRSGKLRAKLLVKQELLPFQLKEPPQDRLLWYRGTLDPQESQHWVSTERMRRHLSDIREAGFTSISVFEKSPRLAQQMIDLIAEAGFSRNVLLVHELPIAKFSFHGLTPRCYLSDEFDGHGPSVLIRHRERWSQEKDRVDTFASVLERESLERIQDCPPTHVALSMAKSCAVIRARRAFPELYPESLYLYWPLHLERPTLHRLLAGYGLWYSGAQGISPYCYQHLPKYPSDPFNDNQPWEPNFRLSGRRLDLRHHLTTYPSQTGPISTVQWEGVKQGLTDLAYLYTWESILESQKGRQPERVRASRRALQSELPRLVWEDIHPSVPQPIGLGARDLDRIREFLIDDILSYVSQNPGVSEAN